LLDVRDAEGVKAAVADLGSIDVLVNKPAMGSLAQSKKLP